MTTTRKPTRCQSCGHRGGALELRRSEDFDALADQAGLDAKSLVSDLWLCSGRLFAADGPVECLRRSTAR